MSEQSTLEPTDRWLGRLTLELANVGGRCRITRSVHQGPLLVQRAFYPESPAVCHLCILHPPGGVVSGDTLELAIRLTSGSQAVVTTPSATKFYRSKGPTAEQQQHFTVEQNAELEWLPQESIIFDQALVESSTKVSLTGNARFIGWEITCFGRPAANERFASGSCRQTLSIERNGRPVIIDRLRTSAGSEFMEAPWGLAGYPVSATLLATPADAELTGLIRDQLTHAENLAITHRDGILIIRYLGNSSQEANRLFRQAWSLLRPIIVNRPACPPRIWNT